MPGYRAIRSLPAVASHAIGFAEPRHGIRSLGVRAYEEDGMEQSNWIFLVWRAVTAQVNGFCPIKSRTFGVVTAAGHSGAAAKNWSRAPAQGC
jgi:hypothetical protein